jgi:hypothetical protein
MPVITRSADDLIIDKMVLALQEFFTEQVAMDPEVGANVERDRIDMPTMADMPLVNIWLDTLTPVSDGSSAKTLGAERARIYIDCYAKGLDTNQETADDGVAMRRLYYLKQQVKHGLYRLRNVDYNLPAGSIQRKTWPSWELFKNDLRLPEQAVVAGRWTVEVEYNWAPEDITGVLLDQITVDASLWSATYNYNEGD